MYSILEFLMRFSISGISEEYPKTFRAWNLCCIHKQKESSGGIYSLFHTKYLQDNKDNCTRAITLRSPAMSVTTSL